MYNFDIKKQRKLEDLVDIIVPQTFRTEAPQFTDMIRAFLVNIEQVQTSINQTFLDIIDPDKIQSNDIMKLYFDTYLKTLNLESTENFLESKDLLNISKELVLKKGTPFIYNVLINLLMYIFPNVGNQYQEYLIKLKDPTLTDNKRKYYEENIAFLESEGFDKTYVNVIEDDLFSYIVEADLDEKVYHTYVKPFCHPAGWHEEFIQVYYLMVQDTTIVTDTFMICEITNFPIPTAKGDFIYDDLLYPNIFLTDRILGDDSLYYEIVGLLTDPSRLYIDKENIIADGRFIADGSYLCDGVDNLKTWYKDTKWTTTETIEGDWNSSKFLSKIPSGAIPIVASNEYVADGNITANYSMLANGINNEFIQTYYLDGEN
ncbi:MAG: hypothetical protein QM489_03970 [Candidatus Izemoplasma sp.]